MDFGQKGVDMEARCGKMKRWILWTGITVLFLSTSVAGIAWWRPVDQSIATAMTWSDFAAKWMVNWEMARRERMADGMKGRSEKNLESEVIRIEMEGRHYDVPIRYTHWEAFVKRGYWPKVKPERVKVGALSLSVLLPDMKPYYPEDEARWKARGHGDRVQVSIQIKKIDWFQRYRDSYFDGQDQFSTRQGEIHGLALFARGGAYMNDIYFPVDATIELAMSCSKKPKSADFFPGCSVTSNYRPDIVLDYSYSKDYLPGWREIDLKLKALFDRFEQAV
jgi:hypothetical protein